VVERKVKLTGVPVSPKAVQQYDVMHSEITYGSFKCLFLLATKIRGVIW